LNFLEIGLGVTGDKWKSEIVHGKNTGGASIRMWHDYFKNSKIFGIDINECSYLDKERIKTFVVDQGNENDLTGFIKKSCVEEFDFIIDDGSHRPDHQQISFNLLFKKLKPGGLYFIEDLLSNGYGDRIKGRMSSDKVRNTRSILKHFKKTGELLTPHLLTDEDYIKEQVDYIRFHVPQTGIKYVLGKTIQRPLGKVVYQKLNTERLCVIRKK
jgi:hypothetical protein